MRINGGGAVREDYYRNERLDVTLWKEGEDFGNVWIGFEGVDYIKSE